MNLETISRVLLAPHVSEKAMMGISKKKQYIFKVMLNATKLQIKQSVEQMFKTKVDTVRIVNVKTKPKRFGNTMGRTKAWKKAYVTLKEGQAIEMASMGDSA